MVHVNLWVLRQVWGNNHFDFASASARAIEGLWIPTNVRIMWVAVYAPQNLSSKIVLWDSLANLINNWDGISVTMGDFNEVREAGERFGSSYNERQADLFNNFIFNASLIDVPLGGYKFTWTDKWGSKMSKIDRFLVSELFYETFPNISGVILEKGIPDHRPILIKDYVVDFGPTPFWFFHSWFEIEGFHSMVVDTWKNDGIVEANGLISFKKKLQNLKRVIREWVALQRSISLTLKKDHLMRLSSVDTKIDQGLASEMDLCDRRESIHILGDLDKREASDIAQKSRIKWALEGDENSNFFHASLKKSRRHHSIKEFLERDISRDEIKRDVWDCGGDRAPGPDGFTFKFFTSFWDLIKADVCRFVHEFFSTGAFPKGCNSSFIALIPKVSNATLVTNFRPISLIGFQYKIIGKILANRLSMVIGSCISPEQSAFIKDRNILDGPLVLSEMMAWHRKNKKKLMIFKVDFEKAFDSLKWDFLDLVMDKIGFGCRWSPWIKGCLRNARASVLVNGSPTKEFEIFRGLRQGDPLSHFLFILAMEGLHAFICKAMNMGVGMSNDDIQAMANVIGCGAAILPFKYLGVPARLLSAGGRLTLIKSVLGSLPLYFMSLYMVPISVCNKLESMRNHFFIGADMGEKKMTWVRWKKCLASKNMGGLGIRSIFALNVGLLFKWIWRFLCNSTDLWIKVIKEMYGFHGGIFDENMQRSSLSPWCGILSSIKALKNKGIDLLSLCSRKLGNGVSIRFWDDVWWGDTCLKSLFPRVYLLDTERTSSVTASVSAIHVSFRVFHHLLRFSLMIQIYSH
ncbi:putative RNA-directed DNA polymerase, eukaryota, reverse transcriptase zinc-binding domain protein [Tanacetum coccineum]